MTRPTRWLVFLLSCGVAASLGGTAAAQEPEDVPVTIKELDVAEAIREFQDFQRRLGEFREEISGGRALATETAQILEDLRQTAGPQNDFNEGPILEAIAGYVDGVVGKQVDLVDFLESQRYRISYYASKMASSVRPEEISVIFGTESQNTAAIGAHVRAVDAAQAEIATFIDSLPPDQFDLTTFRPMRDMSREDRRKLDRLVYAFQQEKNALELAKKRLQLVRAAHRGTADAGAGVDIDTDLLVGQMFGALDRIRLQMSIDLMYLEQMLSSYAQSARTEEILTAFQSLIEMQGSLEGPSPELTSVLDWLQDSSIRRINLSAAGLEQPGLSIPRSSELLREAYTGARGAASQGAPR